MRVTACSRHCRVFLLSAPGSGLVFMSPCFFVACLFPFLALLPLEGSCGHRTSPVFLLGPPSFSLGFFFEFSLCSCKVLDDPGAFLRLVQLRATVALLPHPSAVRPPHAQTLGICFSFGVFLVFRQGIA